jgi:hypothetical protein
VPKTPVRIARRILERLRQITLDSGKTEHPVPRYYNNKGSDQLGLAIRCQRLNKIEMRADLNYAAGSVSGTWEERTFNATGHHRRRRARTV